MSDVALTDFTPEQLQVMLASIDLLRREKKIGCYPSHAEDDVNLVRTQILTAIGTVAMREKVTST